MLEMHLVVDSRLKTTPLFKTVTVTKEKTHAHTRAHSPTHMHAHQAHIRTHTLTPHPFLRTLTHIHALVRLHH